MNRIFISYRRSTSLYSVQVLSRWLADHFGAGSFFLDTDIIQPGESFPERIRQALSDCDIFLPLFGKGWESLAKPDGMLRLHQSDDWVRREIAMALERRSLAASGQGRPILIVPLIETGATQPGKNNLPEELLPLAEIDTLRFDNARSLDELLHLIDRQFAGGPMGKFGMRVLNQAHDPSCHNRYRFRYAHNNQDLQIFVSLSDDEAAIACAHPGLSGEDRLNLYRNWAQWTAPDSSRPWTLEGNTGRSFLLLEQLQPDGTWLAIGISIMLPLTLDGARHLLQTDNDRSWEDDASAVSLAHTDITPSSRRLLLDTWIIRKKETFLLHKTPRVEHHGWGRTLQLRHIAELIDLKSAIGFTLFCEPDNRLIAKMLQDLGFEEEKRNFDSGKLFVVRYPLNEERHDEASIARFETLLKMLQSLREIDIL